MTSTTSLVIRLPNSGERVIDGGLRFTLSTGGIQSWLTAVLLVVASLRLRFSVFRVYQWQRWPKSGWLISR